MNKFLGFDIGGSKTAWGVVDENGEMIEQGGFPTIDEPETLLQQLMAVARTHHIDGIGMGVAGVLSADRRALLISPYLPRLGELPLAARMEERLNLPVSLDNDARCALIGETWLGAARVYSDLVLLTLGTGVGGAVMQNGRVLPHPLDISREIGRIMVDPTDVFPALSGPGTVEALLGGRNLEKRFDLSMEELARKSRAGEAEAGKIWQQISSYFIQALRVIHAQYDCPAILIGGRGGTELDLYLQEEPPCPVRAAELGEAAGIYGAARLALDQYKEA